MHFIVNIHLGIKKSMKKKSHFNDIVCSLAIAISSAVNRVSQKQIPTRFYYSRYAGDSKSFK